MDLRKLVFGAGRSMVRFTDRRVGEVLQAAKTVVSGSLKRSADLADRIADIQITRRVSVGMRSASEALRRADAASSDGLITGISETAKAFRYAIGGIDVADEYTRRNVLDNVHVSSIVGSSFAGVTLSEIRPSFRADGQDVSAEEMARRFADSGLRRAVLCVPGLLSDESLWTNEGGDASVDRVLDEHGLFPVYMRFNPGTHISDNGAALLTMVCDFLSRGETAELVPDVLTFSLGGLIFRSALYRDRSGASRLIPRLGRAVLVSSPDGGSYLEKLGFWVGEGLQQTRLPLLHLIGLVGNQRSDGIRDLSHGLIREEDWKSTGQVKRYGADRYFGELDDVDAYQIYSVLHPPHEPWRDWIGDGIVERSSLALLSEVYRAKGGSTPRVRVLEGKSHYQVLHDPETCRVISSLLSAPANVADPSSW